MSNTREIKLGKVVGLNSYELAVKYGTFTGTLSEYLNKEQKYYNDMIIYGTQLKDELESYAFPNRNLVENTAVVRTIAPNTETVIRTMVADKAVYGSLSAFVKLESATDVTKAVMNVYVNDTLVFATGVSNNILNLSTNIKLAKNDTIKVSILHKETVSKLIEASNITLFTIE